MDKVDTARNEHRAEEYLKRAAEYRQKLRYDSKYIQPYIGQMKLYLSTKEKIKDEVTKMNLSRLELELLG